MTECHIFDLEDIYGNIGRVSRWKLKLLMISLVSLCSDVEVHSVEGHGPQQDTQSGQGSGQEVAVKGAGDVDVRFVGHQLKESNKKVLPYSSNITLGQRNQG